MVGNVSSGNLIKKDEVAIMFKKHNNCKYVYPFAHECVSTKLQLMIIKYHDFPLAR